MSKKDKGPFSFEISLSVLNHLGRHLYRNFSTVLGEAISNSWDADASNVYIYIDRELGTLTIIDDGLGMTSDDFQNKFLRIGFSKRANGSYRSTKDRPFIGRKGIGKLALLSCAETVTIISKTQHSEFIGGVIQNSELDEAIKNDLVPDQYPLQNVDLSRFQDKLEKLSQGTLIHFDGIKGGIRNLVPTLMKSIALYFRFSLIDSSFNIYVNEERVTTDSLLELIKDTDFIWNVNQLTDPYLSKWLETRNPKKTEYKVMEIDGEINGFIGSVKKPSNLKVRGTEEAVTVDLFVNGRLRERDILRHIPTARVVESYLYGQIHFNSLDDDVDRFTSSRESVVADDPKFEALLKTLREDILKVILEDWDVWRRKHKKDGDSENSSITKKARKSTELFNAIAEDYAADPSESDDEESVQGAQGADEESAQAAMGADQESAESQRIAQARVSAADRVESWLDELSVDASFNFISYAECYTAENLVRMYIEETEIQLSPEAQSEVEKWSRIESENKEKGNLSIEIRKTRRDLSYLDMSGLAHLVDKTRGSNDLPADTKVYRPIRDAVMHTSQLTDEAKLRLTTVFQNIQARIKTLLDLSSNSSETALAESDQATDADIQSR